MKNNSQKIWSHYEKLKERFTYRNNQELIKKARQKQVDDQKNNRNKIEKLLQELEQY